MVAQPGDTGVASYVAQAQADGAIGYTEYSYALQTGFPGAKVLNAAGYYPAPTPGHVAVSLLQAQINQDASSPLYLTADLSQVYTDPDPRTYELSSYSYMIVPTDLTSGMTTDKGYTLGAFGQYLLPGPVPGGRARLLRAADQPGRGGLRPAAEDPRRTGADRHAGDRAAVS